MGQIRAYDEREYRQVAARIGDKLELPQHVVKRLQGKPRVDDGDTMDVDLNYLALTLAQAARDGV